MKKLGDNILSWCESPDETAVEQAINLSKHPCLVGNVCLMSDTHGGFGMPIGGVVALENAVSPNMVGVDINCGVLAVQTNLSRIDREKLESLVNVLYNIIPLGFSHHEKPQDDPIFDNKEKWENTTVCLRELDSARKQLGTLGGGNHFIEIQKGNDGHVWFMLHSGSRNLGFKVAHHYNELAKKLCKMWKHDDVVENDIAFLPIGTKEAADYLREMKLCGDFAFQNRAHMANIIKKELAKLCPEVSFTKEVNIHHNYAALEYHYGKNVWVHRKGATLARKGTIGIIPGSQGTRSYIVEGLGNEASLQSCSHGAGRKMSRKKAVSELNLENEKNLLDNQGIIHRLDAQNKLDEAAGAYKDINTVMNEQKDLVKVLVELSPLAVIKG